MSCGLGLLCLSLPTFQAVPQSWLRTWPRYVITIRTKYTFRFFPSLLLALTSFELLASCHSIQRLSVLCTQGQETSKAKRVPWCCGKWRKQNADNCAEDTDRRESSFACWSQGFHILLSRKPPWERQVCRKQLTCWEWIRAQLLPTARSTQPAGSL